MSVFIHPSADVQTDRIGDGTKIWQYVVVLPGATIGRGCNVNAHCLIEGEVVIGDNVTLKCGVYVWNGITIEDDVFVGPNVTFTNDPAPRSKQYPDTWAQTRIRRGASIGANVTLLPGVTIGEYAMIGAGSVVTKDVPAHTVWFGNPAEWRGYVCRCGAPLGGAWTCERCGRRYTTADDGTVATRD